MVEGSLPSAARAWVEEALGAPATGTTVLAGGTHASTWRVRATDPAYDAVLRLLPEDDPAAGREVRVLTALDGLDGLAPRLLAADENGARAGQPAVLISRLSGAADLTELPPTDAAAQLGRVLARVHATPVAGLEPLGDRMAHETDQLDQLPEPAAERLRAVWPRLAVAPRVLTHFDFWSGNVVWDAGHLSGVVDWSGATLAPRGFDVGWCRLDLYLLHGEHTAADVFLDAYETAARMALPDVGWWDLHAAARSHHQIEEWRPNYAELGRADLTPDELRKRQTAWFDQRSATVAEAG